MHIRKKRKKWQCIVRHKGHMVTQTFVSKSDASLWGHKIEADLINGTYQNNDKLIQMRFKDLLHLYLEKALHKSKRPKILKYDVELMRRMPLARYTLAQ
jgi:hypothetical protein